MQYPISRSKLKTISSTALADAMRIYTKNSIEQIKLQILSKAYSDSSSNPLPFTIHTLNTKYELSYPIPLYLNINTITDLEEKIILSSVSLTQDDQLACLSTIVSSLKELFPDTTFTIDYGAKLLKISWA